MNIFLALHDLPKVAEKKYYNSVEKFTRKGDLGLQPSECHNIYQEFPLLTTTSIFLAFSLRDRMTQIYISEKAYVGPQSLGQWVLNILGPFFKGPQL